MKKAEVRTLRNMYQGKVFRSNYDGIARWVTHVSTRGILTLLRLDEEEQVWRHGGKWRHTDWWQHGAGPEAPELLPCEEYTLVGVYGQRATYKVVRDGEN